MNCIYCGTEVKNGAVCCPRCGGTVASGIKKTVQTKKSLHNNVHFAVRPSVAPGLVFIRLFPLLTLIALIATAILGTLIMLVLELFQFHYGIYSYYVVGASCMYLMVIAPIATVVRNSGLSRYTFYNDRMEYIEAGLSNEVKILEYTTILDMNLTRGLFQRAYNFGTIRIFAVGSTQDYMVVLRDIKNADRVYRKIADLIEKR